MTSILVSPEKRNSELASQLERSGLRIIAWPPVQLDPALNQFALDDAIGNLFGYDWLILKSAPAAQFFLKRFTEAGRSVDELDGLRVWAIGEQTIASLRENQIHIDIEAEGRVSNRIVEALADYVGGHQLLSGLNFLLPSANITRETYQDRLEEVGARVDAVITYRTTSDADALAQLNALRLGGGIDFVLFESPGEIEALAQLFDTADLSQLLREITIVCADQQIEVAVQGFGIAPILKPSAPANNSLSDLILASAPSRQ